MHVFSAQRLSNARLAAAKSLPGAKGWEDPSPFLEHGAGWDRKGWDQKGREEL